MKEEGVVAQTVWLLFDRGVWGFQRVYATRRSARRAFAARAMEWLRTVDFDKKLEAEYKRLRVKSLDDDAIVDEIVALYLEQDHINRDSGSRGIELVERVVHV